MPHGFLSPSRPRCRDAGDAVPYDYYAGTCQPRRVRALFLRTDRVVRPYGGASGTPPFIQNTRRLSRRGLYYVRSVRAGGTRRGR